MAKLNMLLYVDNIMRWRKEHSCFHRLFLLSITILLLGSCLIYILIWRLGGDEATLKIVLKASVAACVTFFLMFILFIFLFRFHGTSLHYAAFCGRKKVVEHLIAKGKDVNVKTKTGWTPLHEAAVSGHTDIAKVLLENGAVCTAVDAFGRTPLYLAAFCGHKELVELLITTGADVNAQDTEGRTPLSAVMHEAPKVTPKYGRYKKQSGEKRLKEIAELLRTRGGSE